MGDLDPNNIKDNKRVSTFLKNIRKENPDDMDSYTSEMKAYKADWDTRWGFAQSHRDLNERYDQPGLKEWIILRMRTYLRDPKTGRPTGWLTRMKDRHCLDYLQREDITLPEWDPTF